MIDSTQFPSIKKQDIGDNSWGCIEDRSFVQQGEVNQAPGGDAFFCSASDAIQEADVPDSVGASFTDTVTAHIGKIEGFSLHNDADHGDKYDGCGFLAHQKDIYTYLENNIGSVLEDLTKNNPDSLNEVEVSRAKELAVSAGRLAKKESYFTHKGGELVGISVEENQVNLLTYSSNHTANNLVIDTRNDETYDSENANDQATKNITTFSVDVDNAMANRASQFNIGADDTKLFAKILAVATVRVLGATGEIYHK